MGGGGEESNHIMNVTMPVKALSQSQNFVSMYTVKNTCIKWTLAIKQTRQPKMVVSIVQNL